MFNIDTIELISEYNVYQELLMAYEKQLVMEAYILEDGEATAEAGIGASIKSGAAKAGSAIKSGGEKLGKGLLNLLKKGYNLFVRFLNKLKQMFANAKKKLTEKPWYEVDGAKIRILDKRVLELVKSKYKNLIFDESGVFVQTTGARDVRETKQTLNKIYTVTQSENFNNSLRFFNRYIDKLDNERTAVSDSTLAELGRYTKINKAISDDLKKILNSVNNSKPVKLEDITDKSGAASVFDSTNDLIAVLIDKYDTHERIFKNVVEFFEDKYGLHDKDELGLKMNYNKALKAIVDHLNVITGNLKSCLELADKYNLTEYNAFRQFLHEGDVKSFNTDYHQYKADKRSEQRKADKEKFDKKMDDLKSKFKKKNKDDE
jgi:hypothetical protein